MELIPSNLQQGLDGLVISSDPLVSLDDNAMARVLGRVGDRIVDKLEPIDARQANSIVAEHHLTPLLSELLVRRGFSAGEDLAKFLSPQSQALPSPSMLKGCEQAARLVIEAMADGKPIAINGDFDVDGMASAAMWKEFFEVMGVRYEVIGHDRYADGFGFHKRVVDEAIRRECGLVIAVDHGVANLDTAEYARGRIKTVVIDHHALSPYGKPRVDALVDPADPECNFCDGKLVAAGVSYFVIARVEDIVRNELKLIDGTSAADFQVEKLLGLACVATVADVGSLTGVNRIILAKGLEQLSQGSASKGFYQLGANAGRGAVTTAEKIAFLLAARINAICRILTEDDCGRPPSELGVELLSGGISEQRASTLAAIAEEQNYRRQHIENDIVQTSYQQLVREPGLENSILVLNENFHLGTIGCAASRLSEQLMRPAGLFGADSDGNARGSLRGAQGVDIAQALSECSTHLLKFGGHRAAGGCTVKPGEFEKFKDRFEQVISSQLGDFRPMIKPELVMSLPELINREGEIVDMMQRLAPIGRDNPAPKIMVPAVSLGHVRSIKGRHLALTCRDRGYKLNAFLWHHPEHPEVALAYPGDPNHRVSYTTGEKLDLVVEPTLRSDSGTSRALQYSIVKVRKSRASSKPLT